MVTEVLAFPDPAPWLLPVITLIGVLFGSGGVAAVWKLRHDKRIGISNQEIAEDVALDQRWRNLIEAQTTVLLKPMELKIRELEERCGRIEADLAATRAKYWRAIAYIRQLLNWASRHMPEGAPPTPIAPADLANDI